MVDFLSPSDRSERMSRIRGRDTQPELALRKALHRMGFRYRLHEKKATRKARYCSSSLQGRGLCPWLLLAPSSGMQDSHRSQEQYPILAGEVPTQCCP